MWNPQIKFRNGFAPRVSDNIRIYNFNDGTILYRETFTTSLMTQFDLTKIPFDSHTLHLDVGSLTYDNQYVELLIEDQTVFLNKDFYMVEFDMTGTGQKFTDVRDEYTDKSYSVMEAQFNIKRQWPLYFYKIIIPLYLLIFITSLIFKYENLALHDRMDICLACILAAIAYQIVIEEKVPKFLFFNFLNTAVFCGVLVMGYGIAISYVL